MRLDRFDLNLLVVLEVLLEEKNVTRAGERLHIGQSAVSAALSRLREHFDDDLLVSIGRRFELTPLAQTLVEPVRNVLVDARTIISRRPTFNPATEERSFVICASDYVTTVLLSQVVTKVAKLAPGLVLTFRSPPKNLADAFDRGRIDMVILPDQYLAPFDCTKVDLFSDTHVCLVWSEHDSIGESLSFDAYMTLGHIAVRFGEGRGTDFDDLFLPKEARNRRVESSVDNFATLPSLLMGTQRVATLHRRMAEHFARYMPLRVLPAPFSVAPVVESLAWAKHLEFDSAHAWLRNVIIECAVELN
jgi:LysR family transcriptional regulator, nod-box dependent transcriptional activator